MLLRAHSSTYEALCLLRNYRFFEESLLPGSDCKTSIPGSNPGGASNAFNELA